MGWHTGTATDYLDLMQIISTKAQADGWTELRNTTGGTAPHDTEIVLEGPGFGTGFEVYAEMRSYEDDPNSIFSIEGRGITSYGSGLLFELQIGVSLPVFMNLWNDSMDYWISVSDRRIIVIAKVSNTYHSLHLGLLAPFSSPVEYPYPMYVASDSGVQAQFGDITRWSRSIANPGLNAAYLRDAMGVWRTVAVYADGGGNSATDQWIQYNPGRYTVFPYASPMQSGDNPSGNSQSPAAARFSTIPGIDDSLPIMPCTIQALFDKGGQVGVIEGLYWTPGFGLGTEQEVTIGADTYQTFIAISRSTEQPSNFYMVKEA